jgi:hypothetical protein
MDCGASARPFTFKRSAVFRNAGSCSCETLTSPAYINSSIDCRWLYGTSFKIIIGCFDGFSYKSEKSNPYNVSHFIIINITTNYNKYKI